MKLGFFVLNEINKEALLGLTQGAKNRGWEVRWFINDFGTLLLEDPEVLAFAEKVAISFCEYSAKKLKVPIDNLPKKIKKGTQLNNAILHQQCDKVILL